MAARPASRIDCGPPLPTPTYGPGGSFTISCSARIAAPPGDCLRVVTEAPGYAAWNRFCRKCTIDAQPNDAQDNDILNLGTKFTFDVHMNPDEPDGTAGRAVALEVSVLEPIDDDLSHPPGFPPHAPEAAEGGRRKGWRIAWKQRGSLLTPGWVLRNERVQDFVEVNGGAETEYYCWETFYGALAPVVKLAVGKQVEKGFGAWLNGLKGQAEKTGQAVAA